MADQIEKLESEEMEADDEMMEEGWSAVTSERSSFYFHKAKGASITGQLLGRFERGGHRNKKKYYYQIRVSQQTDVVEAVKGEDSIEREVEAGTVVNVDETSALQALQSLTEDGKKYLISIKCLSKEKIDGGQTYWRMRILKKAIDEDIPF